MGTGSSALRWLERRRKSCGAGASTGLAVGAAPLDIVPSRWAHWLESETGGEDGAPAMADCLGWPTRKVRGQDVDLDGGCRAGVYESSNLARGHENGLKTDVWECDIYGLLPVQYELAAPLLISFAFRCGCHVSADAYSVTPCRVQVYREKSKVGRPCGATPITVHHLDV